VHADRALGAEDPYPVSGSDDLQTSVLVGRPDYENDRRLAGRVALPWVSYRTLRALQFLGRSSPYDINLSFALITDLTFIALFSHQKLIDRLVIFFSKE